MLVCSKAMTGTKEERKDQETQAISVDVEINVYRKRKMKLFETILTIDVIVIQISVIMLNSCSGEIWSFDF